MAFLSEDLGGEGGFLVDQPIVHILIFLPDAYFIHDCTDAAVTAFDRDKLGEVHGLHLIERLNFLLGLECAQIRELREGGSTFILEILLRWRSLARYTSFL